MPARSAAGPGAPSDGAVFVPARNGRRREAELRNKGVEMPDDYLIDSNGKKTRFLMQAKIDLHEDVFNGVIKSVVFGLVCTWIALFQGYDAVPTSEGVSRATTRTVVHSSLAVLGLDFVLTALMFNE